MGAWKFASRAHGEDDFLHDEGGAGRGIHWGLPKCAMMQSAVDKLSKSRSLPHGCGVKHHPHTAFLPITSILPWPYM